MANRGWLSPFWDDEKKNVERTFSDLGDKIEALFEDLTLHHRVEHIFGAQETAPGGRLVRTIGELRAKAKIALQNLCYNIRRLVIVERMAAA